MQTSRQKQVERYSRGTPEICILRWLLDHPRGIGSSTLIDVIHDGQLNNSRLWTLLFDMMSADLIMLQETTPLGAFPEPIHKFVLTAKGWLKMVREEQDA